MNFSSANPIFPESLIAEVYFENDEWYFAIDNLLLEIYGIENFENIGIFCNDGPLEIKSDFLPDFSQSFTILTNDNLVYPVEIIRSGDSITSFWDDPYYGYFEFTTLVWNDILPSPVFGPLPGQALSIIMVPVEDFEYEWWLTKNSSPWMLGGGYNVYGSFEGYIYDQNNIPIPNVRIRYIDPYYILFPYNCFDTLMTDINGYFQIELPARNYYISHVYKNGALFNIDEYISVEPDFVNFYEFTIDYIVGIHEPVIESSFDIFNYPNPFSTSTEFVIDCHKSQHLNNAYITISDHSGKILTIIPVRDIPNENGQIKIKWTNSPKLVAGNYIYSIYQDQNVLATSKMMICE